jgi:hypothetical protein
MNLFRSIAVMLILVLASTPTLAAICATSCASESAMVSLSSSDLSEMQHCHEDSKGKHTNKPSTEHNSCVMGTTCHFTQVISEFDSLTKFVFADLTRESFPKFVPQEKSIDLSPPLKPPA